MPIYCDNWKGGAGADSDADEVVDVDARWARFSHRRQKKKKYGKMNLPNDRKKHK